MSASRRSAMAGFMLLEALFVAAVFFSVLAAALGVYFVSLSHSREVAEEASSQMLAESIESAVRAGAVANLRADGRSFHFVFEGVAVRVDLPPMPGDVWFVPAGEPWLYPAGLLIRLPDGVIDPSGRLVSSSAGGIERIMDPILVAEGLDLGRYGVVSQDEDCGIDGLPDYLEPGAKGPDGGYGVAGFDDNGDGVVDDVGEYLAAGSDDVHDPDGDDFDPVTNPFGTEGDGVREPGEPDSNGNGYLDSPPRSRPPYVRDAGAPDAAARFAAMLRPDPSRDFGYRLRVRRAGPIGTGEIPAGAGPAYRVTIEIYPGFAESRRRLATRESIQRMREWQFLLRFT